MSFKIGGNISSQNLINAQKAVKDVKPSDSRNIDGRNLKANHAKTHGTVKTAKISANDRVSDNLPVRDEISSARKGIIPQMKELITIDGDSCKINNAGRIMLDESDMYREKKYDQSLLDIFVDIGRPNPEEMDKLLNEINERAGGFPEPFAEIIVPQLDYEKELSGLQELYKSYGTDAWQHESEINAALEKIISKLLADGGAYINKDKTGVADSIRSIFRGEESKYSLKDISALAMLSEQRLIDEDMQGANEFVLGASLGYENAAIEALRLSGQLGDEAYRTAKNALGSQFAKILHADMARRYEARTNGKPEPYPPFDPNIVNDVRRMVVNAAQSGDFNAGIRTAFAQIEELYKDHLATIIENMPEKDEESGEDVTIDKRFERESFYDYFKEQDGESADFDIGLWVEKSNKFAEHFGMPWFALESNLLSTALS